MNEQKPKLRNQLAMMLGLVAASTLKHKPSDGSDGVIAATSHPSVRDQKKKQRNRVMDKIEKKSRKINYQRAK